MKMVDIVTLIRVKRLNCIGPINWIDDTGKVKKIFGSQPKGVRTRGSQRSRWWICVWTDIKKGRNKNCRETCRNRNEWKKVIEA
jgi:hypothetical protein